MARNRKRRKGASKKSGSSRDASAAGGAAQPGLAGSSAPNKLFTLEGFATLPHELKKRIIDLACSPSPPPSTTGRAPRPLLDIATTLSLAFASRDLYSLIVPVLYASVFITRPSSLASFHLALTSKPSLGRLVKSLHVGPSDVSPEWDPLLCDEGYILSDCSNESEMYKPDRYFLITSLQSDEEAKLLPEWCARDRQWPLDEPGRSAAAKAVWDAVREAQWVVDINLQKPSQRMQTTRWESLKVVHRTQRLAEAQAVLDLYLMELRRWEDKKGISRGKADSDQDSSSSSEEEEEDSDEPDGVEYPSLVLTGYPAPPSRPSHPRFSQPQERFVIDRAQILRHLARPRCEYDWFDHHVLFARSGEQSILSAICEYDFGGRATHKFRREPEENWDEFFFDPDVSSPDWSLPNTSTMGSLLSLLSSVLSHTTNLEHLSLTGFLERAACGTRGAAALLKKLRTVTFGPPPFTWYAPLHLQLLPAGLEELRLSGIRLHEEELAAIIRMFPRLKRFHWSMMYQFSEKHTPSLQESVARLVGRKGAFEAARRPSGEGSDESSGESSSSSSSSSSSEEGETSLKSSREANAAARSRSRSPSCIPVPEALPLIEISLYPSDLQRLLQSAPSPAARAAWLSGGVLPDQERRLLLSESRRSLRVLYDEGREWWEERAGGGGGGEG